MRQCLMLIALLLAAAIPNVPGGDAIRVPDLLAGEKRGDDHDWTLGPTGARGWVWSTRMDTTLSRQILITKVDPGSPADGNLITGDVIVGVGGKPFADDARKTLGRAITEAERAENRGLLRVQRWRQGTTAEAAITLKVMGTYSDTAPFACAKSAAILEQCCRYLAKHGPGDGVLGAINGLGMMATGKPEFVEATRALARKLGPRDLKLDPFGRDTGMVAWDWGFHELFLCEYFLGTGDREALPAIGEYARALARGQSGVGTWGHGMAVRSDEHRLGGYGAINQSGLICWIALVLAQKCGVADAEVAASIERSRVFFSFYTGKGSIPYGDHPPYWNLHDTNGKNAIMAVMGDLIGDRAMTDFFARMVTASYDEREAGHTGNFFSYMWGPLGSSRAGPEAVAAFMKEQRWYYDLARSWDGGFPYQGAAADDSYQGWNMAGIMMLTYALPERRLYVTGKGRGMERGLTTAELRATIADGRDFSYAHGDDSYLAYDHEALLSRLASWSPVVRWRAANALAKKPVEVVPRLIAMLGAGKPEACLGACQALECQGSRAAPATDALIRLLGDPDQWLRIRAMYALAGIGQPARKAAALLLKQSLEDDGKDPRATMRRFICMALFIHSHLDDGPRRGLLADSLEGIDGQLLVPAVRRMLTIDDGFSRSCVAAVYPRLDDRELDLLWPDILRSILHAAPSGEMFSDEIRLAGLALLARLHIEEGMAACLEYARNQNLWCSEERTVPIMAALKTYGAAARPALPELRALIDDCVKEEFFGDDDKKKKIAAITEAIKAIGAATDQPPLRSIAGLLGKQPGGAGARQP